MLLNLHLDFVKNYACTFLFLQGFLLSQLSRVAPQNTTSTSSEEKLTHILEPTEGREPGAKNILTFS